MTITSSSSSNMVSSLEMYNAFKKDGTSSLYSIFDDSLVDAVWLFTGDFADWSGLRELDETRLSSEFLGLTGDAVVCV